MRSLALPLMVLALAVGFPAPSVAQSDASAPAKAAPGARPAGKPRDAPAPPKERPAPARPAAAAHEQSRSGFWAEVMVIHAANRRAKGIDPRIGEMPELRKPPFSAYSSYELLQKVRIPLEQTDPKSFELPNHRVLRAQLVQVLPGDVVRLSASINRPEGKTFLPLLEVKAKVGQPFIVAGQSHHGGILVLVIRATK